MNKRYTEIEVLREIYKENEAVHYLFTVLEAWCNVNDKMNYFLKLYKRHLYSSQSQIYLKL